MAIRIRAISEAASANTFRYCGYYCPHPLLVNAPALLRSAVAIHGVRVRGEWKFKIPFDDPRCLEVFHVASELKLPVVLHLDVPYLKIDGKSTYQPDWYGGTIENLERTLLACPDTIFIGHAPGFWREISGDSGEDASMYPSGSIQSGGKLLGLLEEYSNIYADLSAGSVLSALKRDAAFAAQFLNRFADRLLFGRDFYGGELIEFLKSLDLPAATIEKICFKNATHLLGEAN